ncbi:MAG: Rieske 2Fe-2S domain-containing protein [FCB group bacterium]|nr:Rieske 2Fe-2S domain-containing protein [FCB group bacterium]
MNFNKRNIFQRLFGVCITQPPQDPTCWSFKDGLLIVDLDRTSELTDPGGAIRLERDDLPDKVLIIHGDDGNYHAFQNVCQHGKRHLDPVPGDNTVQCCSIGKATYDYEGKILYGSAKDKLKIFPLDLDEGKLFINIE